MLEKIVQLLIANPIYVFVAIVIFAALVYAIYKAKKPMIMMTALYIVAVAEKKWGSKTGQIKYTEAYLYIKKKYPLITLLLPQKTLKKIIEEALENLKRILQEQLKESDEEAAKTIEKLIQEYKDPDEEEDPEKE